MPIGNQNIKSLKEFTQFDSQSLHRDTPPCWCDKCLAETILADRKREEIERKLALTALRSSSQAVAI